MTQCADVTRTPVHRHGPRGRPRSAREAQHDSDMVQTTRSPRTRIRHGITHTETLHQARVRLPGELIANSSKRLGGQHNSNQSCGCDLDLLVVHRPGLFWQVGWCWDKTQSAFGNPCWTLLQWCVCCVILRLGRLRRVGSLPSSLLSSSIDARPLQVLLEVALMMASAEHLAVLASAEHLVVRKGCVRLTPLRCSLICNTPAVARNAQTLPMRTYLGLATEVLVATTWPGLHLGSLAPDCTAIFLGLCTC